MGQILHGSARTTEAVRRAIQHSQEGLKGKYSNDFQEKVKLHNYRSQRRL
jgi:hypothetical protein